MGACCALILVANFAAQAQDVPKYKVDPYWPKPLPHKWLMQGVPVMVVDKDDHIWVMNRPRDVNPDETGAASNPPRNRLLHRRAGSTRIRYRGQFAPGLGRTGLTRPAGRRKVIRVLEPAPNTASW